MEKSKWLLWITIALTVVTVALAMAAATLVGLFLTSGVLPAATLPLGIVTIVFGVGSGVCVVLLWRKWRND